MKSLIKKTYLNLVIIVFGIFLIISANKAVASGFNFSENSGLKNTAINMGYSSNVKTPQSIAGLALSSIITLLGTIFLGLIIYGGMLWLSSEGSEPKLKKAKDILTASVSGLIVVMLSYTASKYIVEYFSKTALQ